MTRETKMRFSEPAPRRGGAVNYFQSPRDKATSPGSRSRCSSGSASPGSANTAAGAVSARGRNRSGVAAARSDAPAPRGAKRQRTSARRSAEVDDEDMPRLVGRPERWNIAQHDLSICQWCGSLSLFLLAKPYTPSFSNPYAPSLYDGKDPPLPKPHTPSFSNPYTPSLSNGKDPHISSASFPGRASAGRSATCAASGGSPPSLGLTST